jgi:ComEC/Rec2-related protein
MGRTGPIRGRGRAVVSLRTGALRWLPLAAVLGWLAWHTAREGLRLEPALLLAAGLAMAAWLAARRLWVTALLVALLLAPEAWQLAVQRPAALRALAGAAGPVRVEGTVRGRAELEPPHEGTVRLLLGDARLWPAGAALRLAELEVELPARSAWGFPYRARVALAGPLRPGTQGVALQRGRLRLAFAAAEFHRVAAPIRPWNGEALRLHLRDRAAYYLSRPALAVYLPIVLGLRERDTPEAREVAAAFRRVGVAHLFAISGLHVGLLYLLFLAVAHWGLGWLQWGQGWRHGPALRRAGVLAAVWLYIALIGFPIPAVRAALMGTLLVWNEQWGTRSPPLYILALAALGVLAPDPSQLYDVSFQLSFLAYFFLLCALGLHRPLLPRLLPARLLPARRGSLAARWAVRAVEGAWLSLWVTLLITLGLWPVVTATFGTLSLLVFLGNLVMVPLLGWLVLPLGLAALAVNLAYAGAAPGAWPERIVCAALDAVLRGWVWIVERLDALSGLLVFRLRPDWTAPALLAYYALLLAGLAWALRRRNARGTRGAAPPVDA